MFLRMKPGLTNGDSNYDYSAIDNVFKWHSVPFGEQAIIHDKVLVVIIAIEEILTRERARDGQ